MEELIETLIEIAKVYKTDAKKYEKNDWTNGYYEGKSEAYKLTAELIKERIKNEE